MFLNRIVQFMQMLTITLLGCFITRSGFLIANVTESSQEKIEKYQDLKFTEQQWKKIDQGEFIILEKKIAKTPWPEWTVVGKMNTSSLAAIAIFSDYGHQVNYVPDLITAKSVKEYHPLSHDVYFELKMPWPLEKANYTTKNTVQGFPQWQVFEIEWSLIKSKSMKSTNGFARFYDYDTAKKISRLNSDGKNTDKNNFLNLIASGNETDQSLLMYRSHIVPETAMAGILRDKAKYDLKKSVEKIRDYLNRQSLEHPGIYHMQIQELKKKWEKAYQGLELSPKVKKESKS